MGYVDETGLAALTKELKTYIDDKTSGGGTPTTLAEIDAAVKSIFESTIVRNNDKYTSNTLTLYTPDADYQTYYIRKRSDADTYAVAWYKTGYNLYLNGSSMYSTTISTNNVMLRKTSLTDRYYVISDNTSYFYAEFPSDSSTIVGLYYSQNYNTLEDAIAAIQDPTTTYTYWSTGNGVNNNPDYIGYSNADYCYQVLNGPLFSECPKLSDNEIIEVIQ